MTSKYLSIKLFFMMFLFSACSAVPLDEGGKSVTIAPHEYDFKSCKYLGESFGLQGTIISYWFTPNPELTTGAINNLKNKAAKMGGNIIELEEGDIDYQTSTVFFGYVYRCPK